MMLRTAKLATLKTLTAKLPVPTREAFSRAAHDPKVSSRIGLWLAITFTICFVTGLLDAAIQHPPAWFYWPSRPVNLFRVTQGLHVLCGVAAIPLLLAKLWSVYPKLFSRPLVRSPVHALERLSILVLSASAFFQLVTGWFNAVQNYPWSFLFTDAHYAVAWVAVGSIVVHVAVKLPVIRAALHRDTRPALQREPGVFAGARAGTSLSRKGFLRVSWAATGAAVLSVAGGTVPVLGPVSVLAARSDNGPQGVPVNKTAARARVLDLIRSPDWRLTVVGRRTAQFTMADLRGLPQTRADLPIACVEGWSASASWTGVPIAELIRLVGGRPGRPVRVTSLQRGGPYGVSVLPGPHTEDPLTLLALQLFDEDLDPDHGYPCRIIAPSRPGVLQTKWVHRLEVL